MMRISLADRQKNKVTRFSSIPTEVEVCPTLVQATNVIASLPPGIHLTKAALVTKPQVLPSLIKVKYDKRDCNIK